MISRTKLDAENDADCTVGLDLEQFHVLMHQAATLVFRNRDLEEDARVVAEAFWRAINECQADSCRMLGSYK